MSTASFNKFNSFVQIEAEKGHNLSTDTLKVMLSNTLPTASMSNKSDITEIRLLNGYEPQQAVQSSSSQSGGVYRLKLNSVTFQASGGSIDPFQYVILYNDSNINKALIGWYDLGAPLTLTIGASLVVNFDNTNGALSIT